MSTSERLDQVRLHLLSLPETGDEIQRESIVIRDEHYVGRRFEMANHRGIWFIETDELKVYAHGEGHLVTLDAAALNADPAESEPHVLPMFGHSEDQPIRKVA